MPARRGTATPHGSRGRHWSGPHRIGESGQHEVIDHPSAAHTSLVRLRSAHLARQTGPEPDATPARAGSDHRRPALDRTAPLPDARCSTTPTAPPRRRSACAVLGRCSPTCSSTRRCCVTSSEVDTSTAILGMRSEQPFAFAPTGFTRLMHHEGERAVARVAERYGVPYALSTMGTTSIEDVAAAAPARANGSSSMCGATAPPPRT